MDWYYVSGTKKVGPVSEAEIEHLVSLGTITPDTMIWNEAMGKWQPYGKVKEGPAEKLHIERPVRGMKEAAAGEFKADTVEARETRFCSQCGRAFPEDEMISYGDSLICASCKPLFFQKLKEGTGARGVMEYAGFWIRFGAKFIDGVIIGIVDMVISTTGTLMFGPMPAPAPGSDWVARMFAVFGVIYLLQLCFQAGYSTFFVGKYAATPGKMACGIKVVTADGGEVSYARALGRHFAEWISAMILLIGYIMAAFDDEKRTLHDRICNTRVIRK